MRNGYKLGIKHEPAQKISIASQQQMRIQGSIKHYRPHIELDSWSVSLLCIFFTIRWNLSAFRIPSEIDVMFIVQSGDSSGTFAWETWETQESIISMAWVYTTRESGSRIDWSSQIFVPSTSPLDCSQPYSKHYVVSIIFPNTTISYNWLLPPSC